jgi:hypothetical protein
MSKNFVKIGDLSRNEGQLSALPSNPRKLTESKKWLLTESVLKFPKMIELRKIVLDSKESPVSIAGNMRLLVIREILDMKDEEFDRMVSEYGLSEQSIEFWKGLRKRKAIPASWVAYADELTEDEKREFIIKDNMSYGEDDWEMLASEWDIEELKSWNPELVGLDDWNKEQEKPTEAFYTNKISVPMYQPSEIKPSINDLYDAGYYDQLVREISESSVSEEVKKFLLMAATRHIVFDYQTIADFYAHSDLEVQELMENSALVIIDFDKAMERGFLKLSETINEQYEKDYEGE